MGKGRKESERSSARDRSQRRTTTGQDIGPPHDVVNPPRKAAAWDSLRLFCESYFPQRFSLLWSNDHLAVLARMQEAITDGGLFALAMPRGTGKTSLSEVATMWASMTGRHPFAMLIAVSATRAAQLLDSIKTELMCNDLLDEDWPEVTHPVRCLEDRANRAKGQHIGGTKTWIGWRKNEIVLPVVNGSAASAAMIRVAGMTSGGIRGPKFVRPVDGLTVRPTLAILDDPQDDKLASNPAQCEKRHRLIHGAVLGMAGPGRTMTALMPCTVIQPADLAERMLDRQQSPLWTGQRYALIERLPDRLDLWDDYGVRRADEFRNDGDGTQATAWYAERRAEMDAGAVVSWEGFRKDADLTALQSAMNLYYLDREAFFAEYQNDPLPVELGSGGQLKASELVKRGNGLARGIAPLAAAHLTAYVDVQQKALYWLVAAWSPDFTGAVVDYGTYPDQGRRYFTLSDVQKTLARAAPGAGLEGSIHAGLSRLAGDLLGREWKREDGAALRVGRLLVDANWGQSTDCVYNWCRTSPYAAQVMPAHGRAAGAASKPWSEFQRKPGEQLGSHWLITASTGRRATRYLLIDTNHWKTFVAERLLQAVGDRGALTFHKGDHRLLADHLCSEFRVRTEGRGRVVDEWKIRPERGDNHWLDCLTGCAAAASTLGVELPGTGGGTMARKQAKWRDVQQAKLDGRPVPVPEPPAGEQMSEPAQAAPAPAAPPQLAPKKTWKQIQEEKRRAKRRGA